MKTQCIAVRQSLLVATMVISFTLTGCATSSAPQSTDSPSTDATVSPTTEDGSLPTPPADETNAFTPGSLSQLCIEATSSAFDVDVKFSPDSTRVEERNAEPRWLILVPAETNGLVGEAQCTIGGVPSDPIIEMAVASVEPMTDQQIQNLVEGVNEGGTD